MKIKSILNQLGHHCKMLTIHVSSVVLLFIDPSNPADTPSLVPLTLGLYVNDFVNFSLGSRNLIPATPQQLDFD
jgi:hypothetical protein